MRAKLISIFRSLAVRNYRLFIVGQIIGLIGTWMQFIAQDWLVLHLSRNPGTDLGFVTALQFTPVLLFTLVGGKLADRYDKRAILIVTNVVWALLAFVLGTLIVSGAVELWHVFVFAACLGTVSAVETPTRQAFASEMVGPELLPNALALNSATFNAARVVGPALAGLFIAWLGTGPVFLLNGATFAAPLIGLLLMTPARLHRAERRPRDTRIVDGLRYVLNRRDLLMPVVVVLFVGMLGFNFQLTLALMSKAVFHSNAASFGLLTTALAAGALCGALAGTGRRRRPSAYVVLGAAMAFGVLETLVGFAPTYWVAALLLLPTGFAMIYFAQAANQRVQLGVDAAYRGRVMALYVLVFLGTNPIGAPLVGWLAQEFGVRWSIWAGGVGSLLTGLVVLAIRSRSVGVRVRVHARPLPHLHVEEPDLGELRFPAGRAKAAR